MTAIFNWLNIHTPLLYLTQSLWRDEAYSVLLSQHSIMQIVKLTAQDFNPPLYYLILHFWMILFGNSEISVRVLSFVFHLLLVYVFYKFIKKVFKSSSFNFQLLASSFVFLNPMLLYYGFEARMYSLLALLATASMYFFYTKNRRGYLISTALGLWTQPFMIFIPFCQFIFLIFTKKFNRFYFFNFLFSFLIFLPWLPTLFSQFRHSSQSWIWPINGTTVTTILGNLLTGYEGTPGGLWGFMTIISLTIILLAFFVLRHPNKEFIKLLLCWLFLPVILVLTISVFKPIYVNRYLIFISSAEVFLIISTLSLIENSSVRFLLNTCCLLLSFFLFFALVPFHQKQNIRQTMSEINYLVKPNDMILAQTPLTLFETQYYSRDPNQVFLYNPKRTTIPNYVGKNLIEEIKQTTVFPIYPKRAFLIHDDSSYEMVYQR